ncbi:MAG: 3-dehydroquinate synthase [Clostridia bacterium]|nr:3-dehydroquinate synthase [Clostridia bacterium]
MNTLHVNTASGGYDIIFQKGGIHQIAELWGKGGKTLIVTDDGVPAEYALAVSRGCAAAEIITLPQGEGTKQLTYLSALWEKMVTMEMTRTDRVIAVGGGVVGDLAGFAAATYMRGIRFYNVPTTVLSQVDSSVGGKTAIDFGSYKNIVGAFWQPSGVLIDAETLASLPPRQVANGLAEAIKMAATYDAELFEAFEQMEAYDLEELLRRAVAIKRDVVQRDERESGERKVLNFGHTLAHALESRLAFDEMYHGECVALGMLPMCAPDVRARLLSIYQKVGLPTAFPMAPDQLIDACKHDKKCAGDKITVVYAPTVGSYEMREMNFEEFAEYIRKVATV